uniref:Uncharacterized protein n=1 Tax=Aegilops tauschii subsp. strangulata TaxID=200361 RepID=A0A453FKI6_AEGTS
VFPGLDEPSYARHGRELHHADRQRVRPYGEHHRPREQRCRCRCGRFRWRPWPRRRRRGLRPRFLGAVLIMKQRET